MADLKVRIKTCRKISVDDPQADDMRILELTEGRKNWRLCLKEEDEEVSDEIIVRIQGILVKNNLVPKNVRR
jgi:hypothetical protein